MQRALLALGVVAALVPVAFPANASAQGGGATPAAQAPPPPPPPGEGGRADAGLLADLSRARALTAARPQTKTAKLSDFKGKQVVVLAFFPAAFSPG